MKTFGKTEVCLAKNSLTNRLPRSFVSIDGKTEDNLVIPFAGGCNGAFSSMRAPASRKRRATAGRERHVENVRAHDFLFCDYVGAVDKTTAEETA